MSTRRYGEWAGRKLGDSEDPARCVVEVPRYRGSYLFRQCSSKRGHGVRGDLCKRHANMEAAGKHLSIPREPTV